MTKQLQGSTDLAVIHEIGDFGIQILQTMKETIGAKVTIPQFNLFMYQMQRMGLDPSLGHGVPIPYGGSVNIRIEYEGIKSLAQKSEGYKGIFTQVVCENEKDDFYAETDENGVITRVNHKIKLPRGNVIGSYAIGKREGFPDFIVICDVAEFDKYAKKNAAFWKLENGSYDPDMCKKHAGTRVAKGHFDIASVVDGSQGEGADFAPEPLGRTDITGQVTQTQTPTAPEKAKSTPRATGASNTAGPAVTKPAPTPAPSEPIDITETPEQALIRINNLTAETLDKLGYEKGKPERRTKLETMVKAGKVSTLEERTTFLDQLLEELAIQESDKLPE